MSPNTATMVQNNARWGTIGFMLGVISLSVFGLRDFTSRLEAAAVTAGSTDLALVIEPLEIRLAAATDARPLIRLGHRLLRVDEPLLASLVLRRAAQLTPDSPDAQAYLAWALLAQLDGQVIASGDRQPLIDESVAALDRATTLNPLNPEISGLRAALVELQIAANGGTP